MHKELNNFNKNSINFNEMNNPIKEQRNEKENIKYSFMNTIVLIIL